MMTNTLEHYRKIDDVPSQKKAQKLPCADSSPDSFRYEWIFELGQEYLKKDDFQNALSCFTQLKKVAGNFESHYFLGLCLEKLGEDEMATQMYLEALLIPTSKVSYLFETYKNIGNLYLKQGNIDLAEDFYYKAYGLQPSSPQLSVNLGTLEIQRKRYVEAIERYRFALQQNPKFSPGWVGMALCYEAFGDMDMAWASVLKAYDQDQSNSTTLFLLGTWSQRVQKTEFALMVLAQHFDSGHFEATLSILFIEICLEVKQTHLALIELERALLWDPTHADLLMLSRSLRALDV